jgi:hypothetical protein
MAVCACLFLGCLAPASFGSADENQPQAPRLKARFLHNPSRLELSDASGAVVASRPLLDDTSRRAPKTGPVHITNAAGNVIYVLQFAAKSARLSAFDLNTGAALGNTDLAAAAEYLQFTSDHSRLMVFGSGNRKLKAREQRKSILTVLDPATLQVKFSQSFGPRASMMCYVDKLDRMLAMDAKSTTMWFVDPRVGEAKPISLGGPMRGRLVSSDGAHLLVLVRNVNKSGMKMAAGGALNQLDVATGQLLHTSQELGDAERLIRLGDGDEYWVLRHGRMQRVTPEGEPTGAVISYGNRDRQLGRGLGGRPGLSLMFGRRYAIDVVKHKGTPSHKVALVDAEAGRVESVTPVGNAAVRRLKAAERWGMVLGLVAADAATGGAAFAASESAIYVTMLAPIPGFQVSGMVVSQDEQTLYALDAASGDVTAVKSNGTVAANFPAKSGKFPQLWKPNRGRFVYYFGKSVVTVIDSTDNKVLKAIPIKKGSAATVMPGRNKFYLCDKNSCEAWDGMQAASAGKLDRQSLDQDADTPDGAPAQAPGK